MAGTPRFKIHPDGKRPPEEAAALVSFLGDLIDAITVAADLPNTTPKTAASSATIDAADAIKTAEIMLTSGATYADTQWRLIVLDLLAVLRDKVTR